MTALASRLARASELADRCALGGAVAAVLVMAAAAIWQVVARYLLAAPPIWTEELARHAMVWAGMLGASSAYRAAADPVLFPQARAVTGRPGLALAAIRGGGVLLLAVPVLWFSLIGPGGGLSRGFIARSAGRHAEMIDISMVWFTVAVPVAFALIVLHMLAELSGRIAALPRERPQP